MSFERFQGPHCKEHVEKQCHQKPIQNERQECHEEFDIQIHVTYLEECEEVVTQHCQEVTRQVHHSSQVVGHDSQVISHGHGGYSSSSHHGKREAEAGLSHYGGHQSYSSGMCYPIPRRSILPITILCECTLIGAFNKENAKYCY